MTYEYKVTTLFVDDVESALIYISDNLSNEKAAKELKSALENTISLICMFPEMGSLLDNDLFPEKDTRFYPIKNYIMYYSYNGKETVYLLRFLYFKRDFLSLFNS